MAHGMLIAVVSAAVVGSLGGGLAAVMSSGPPRPAAPASARPAIAPGAPSTPSAPRDTGSGAPTPTGVRPLGVDALLETQMKTLLRHFVDWSRDHPGEPCPDAAAVGLRALDPWGHPLELTCTDQPADQLIGALSVGPDGVIGTGDDVRSWNLGPEVTEMVRGARWAPIAATAGRAATRPQPGKRPREAARERASKSAAAASPGPVVAPSDQALVPAQVPAREPAPAGSAKPAASASSTVPATRSVPSGSPWTSGATPIDAGTDDIPSRR